VLTFVLAWMDWSFLRDLAAPDYADSAEGGRLWDIGGNLVTSSGV
jgi:hypothetical protein